MTAMTAFQAALIAGVFALGVAHAQAEAMPPSPLAKDIVLVLDNSGSMRQNDPEALTKEAVAAFVAEMEPDTQIGVVLFDRDAREVLPLTRLVDITIDAVKEKLALLNYRGARTNLAAALERALYGLKQQGRPEASRSVVFLTDGIIDTGSRTKDQESGRWLREDLAADAADQGIAIFSIALGTEADVLLLHALAQKTVGDYFRAEHAGDLRSVLDEIRSALLERATPRPVPPAVAEEPAPRAAAEPPAPEPALTAPPEPEPPMPQPGATEPLPPGPAEPYAAPETPPPAAPEAVSPLPSLPAVQAPVPSATGKEPWMGVLPERFAPWLIGFSVVVLAFLAIVAVRILTWVKRGARAQVSTGSAAAAPEPLPKAFLHDLSGATGWKDQRIQKPLTWLGRIVVEPTAEDADHLVIDRATVGRRHAFIEFREHDFWITDHDSVNGTFVNGRRIHTKARLKHGDHIRLGDCELKFDMPAMGLVEETSVVPAFVREAIAGRAEATDLAIEEPPTPEEPVEPFVAVEITSVGVGAERVAERPVTTPRDREQTGRESPPSLRKGVSTTVSRPHGLKELEDPTLPSKKALKDDLKSYFEDP